MEEYIIALDIGTTNIKAGLMDQKGVMKRMLKHSAPLERVDKNGFYRPETIWNIVLEQVEALLKEADQKVAGIGVTGMAEAGLILDRRNGMALTEIIPWFDRRPQKLSEMKEPEKEKEIFRYTGLWNSYKYGIYKYLWLLKDRRLPREKTIWMSICDYVVYKLTGCMVTDPTFAARTYMYHVLEKCWDFKRMESVKLEESNFPQIVESGRFVGYYRGIPVALAGHDHICAAFGLLNSNRNAICDSAGTSETYIGFLESEKVQKGFCTESGLLYGPFVDKGYFYMANVPSSGHSIEWFRKKMQMQEISYEKMNEELQKESKTPGDILYFPYLTGMGAPWYRPNMQGMLLGLKETDTWTDILKGIIEGIQYQARWLLKIVEEVHDVYSDEVICAGGSVNNHFMMQTKSNVLMRTIKIPDLSEATICGAISLILKKNYGESYAEQFLENPVHIKKKYQVQNAVAQDYQKIFNTRYLPIIEIARKYNL